MIHRCLAILTKSLSLVVEGSVDIQYLAGSASPRGLSVAAKKGTSLAVEREPVVGLRSGLA